MKAVKAYYKNGQIALAEPPPTQHEAEVLVVFPDEPMNGDAAVAFKDLQDLVGFINIGGDAVKESDEAYDR
jgi:hypothetical protein